tara:strand:+ start:66 stop:386 length:321 start_codon:yes stop_codon:yes gene_type:complete
MTTKTTALPYQSSSMKITTTYTVAGETFATEQEALDYSHFLDRKRRIVEFFMEYHWIFDDEKKTGVKSLRAYSNSFQDLNTKNRLAAALVNHPEVFHQALDIVEGK